MKEPNRTPLDTTVSEVTDAPADMARGEGAQRTAATASAGWPRNRRHRAVHPPSRARGRAPPGGLRTAGDESYLASKGTPCPLN